MSSKNPNRYGKNKKSVSTTVPVEEYEKMNRLAESGGLKLTAWARLALIEAVRAETVFGISKLKTISFHPHQTMIAAETPGDSMLDPSAESGGGSKKPVQYPKPPRRKS